MGGSGSNDGGGGWPTGSPSQEEVWKKAIEYATKPSRCEKAGNIIIILLMGTLIVAMVANIVVDGLVWPSFKFGQW